MQRSVSPIHLHVGKNAPIHVHLSPKKKKMSESERLAKSFSEMSAGRPSLRAASYLTDSKRLKPREFVDASVSQNVWVPPPGRSSQSGMVWKGGSHKLEIVPGDEDNGGDTVLRMSDLNSVGTASTEIVVENGRPSDKKLHKKVHTLEADVHNLRAEVDLDRSLREYRGRVDNLSDPRRSTRVKEMEVMDLHDELRESHVHRAKLKQAMTDLQDNMDSSREYSSQLEKQRERLVKKLVEAEMDSTAMSQQVQSLRTSLKKINREKKDTSVQVLELSRQNDLLLDKLTEFDANNRSLRKLLCSQHTVESDLSQLTTQKEMLMRQLSEVESCNGKLKAQLSSTGSEVIYNNHLKKALEAKELECTTLTRQIKTLEDKLSRTQAEFEDLQSNVEDLQQKSVRDREALRIVAKQQKDEGTRHEQMMIFVNSKLEEAKSDLSHSRLKTGKVQKEKTRTEAELDVLRMKANELVGALSETKEASKMSMESLNAMLADKSRELSTTQIENEKLKSVVRSAEDRLQSTEATSMSQVSTLKSEVVQLRSGMSQFEDLTAEYKTQVNKLHLECDDLRRQLQASEQEVNRVMQEGLIETEKVRARLQQQISTLETYPETLKTVELRLQTSMDKTREYEERISDQRKLITELTLKSERYTESLEEVREKARTLGAENAFLHTKIEATEKRLQEAEQQNRDFVIVSAKKEERVQQLESRVQSCDVDLSSTKRAMDTSRDETRRQVEQMKDRAAGKERANQARITDLESQLSRANLSLSQMRRSKEEAERRHTTRLSEMKEKYDQANNAHKSLQNYVSLLKTSYVNMFSDLGSSPAKYSP